VGGLKMSQFQEKNQWIPSGPIFQTALHLFEHEDSIFDTYFVNNVNTIM
jgi:hypothetical protein